MNDKSIQLRTVCLLLTVVLFLSLVLIFPLQIAKASIGDLLQEYWVTNGCSGLAHGGDTWHAQTFTANSTRNVTAIELQFNRFAGSPGDVTVSIRNTDGSGEPTGSDLATSNPVNVDGLPADTCSTVHFDFNSPFLELSNGVKYAIVARAPDAVGGELHIGYHQPGGYAPGEAWQSFNAGGSWMWPDNEPTFDLLFRIYGEGQAPTVGSISGMKFNDANGDGAQDPGEEGIAGWSIQLKDENENLLAELVTDGNGHYTFSSLAPATYQVHEDLPLAWTQTVPGGTGYHEIVLSSGQNVGNVDFGNQYIGEPPVTEVGGDIYPVNKLAVLAPWLALAAVILAGTVMAARRYRARS